MRLKIENWKYFIFSLRDLKDDIKDKSLNELLIYRR